MSKIAFILAAALMAFSTGCATTSQTSASRAGVWASWPSQQSMSSELSAAVAEASSGSLKSADAHLTADVRNAEPAAMYLHAEITALSGNPSSAIELFTDFVAQNPGNELAAAALVRILTLANQTSQPLNWNKISKLHVADPYAKSRLIILQNRALRDEIETSELQHPSALALTKWQWIGPFSPYIYTGFDDVQPFDSDPVLADGYLVNDKMVERFQYPQESATVMAATVSGIYAAETSVKSDIEQDYMITVQGAHLYTVYIDGTPVLTRDFSNYGQESLVASRFHLKAGQHVIRLRLGLNASSSSTRHIGVWMSALNDGNAAIAELDELPAGLEQTDSVSNIERIDIKHVLGDSDYVSGDAFRSWVAASLAVSTGRPHIAESIINFELKRNPDDVIAQYWNAMRYRADIDLDPSIRSEKAIHILREIAQNYPEMTAVQQLLISEFIRQHQPKQALEIWQAHKNILPQTAENDALISDLAMALDWADIAADFALKASEKSPNSCSLASGMLQMRHRKNAYTSFDELPQRIQQCSSVIRAFAKLEGNDSAQKNRWSDAIQELSKKHPNDGALKLEAINVRAASDPEGAANAFIDYIDDVSRGYYPNISSESALLLIDTLRANRHDADAERVLAKVLELYPSAEIFRNMDWQHRHQRPYEELRKDGVQIIKDYLAQNRDDAGNSIMILDYAATRIYPSGAKLNLTHQISRVLTKEGKNEVGEVYLPSNASVLNVRTIKNNTFEIVNPESIDYKSSITAPNLEVGDYVETEYLIFEPASSRFSSRAATDAFFYGATTSPLIHSEFIFEYPKDWDDLTVVQSGPANQIKVSCENAGEFKRCSASRENISVVISEQGAPSIMDVIPNIQVYHLYDWDLIRNGLHESITRQSRVSPYVERFYQSLDIPKTESVWERARSIYDQVIQSLDEGESVRGNDDETATNTVTRGVGSRFVTLKALYDIAGIHSFFALIRTSLAPENIENLPSMYSNAYANMLVVETEKGLAYVDPSQDFIPFDYLGMEFQNQPAIPVDRSIDIFTTRKENPEDIRATIDIDYQIDEDGSAHAKSVEVMRGNRAIVMRNFLNTVRNDTDKAHQVIQNSLASSYGRIELTKLEHLRLDEKNEPLTLLYDFDIASFAGAENGELDIISKIFAYNLVNQFAQQGASERKYDLMIDRDVLSRRTLTFHAPAGYQWDTSTLKDIDINTKYGSFMRHTQMNGSDLIVQEAIQILPQRVKQSDYADFRQFCVSVDEAQRTVISAKK